MSVAAGVLSGRDAPCKPSSLVRGLELDNTNGWVAEVDVDIPRAPSSVGVRGLELEMPNGWLAEADAVWSSVRKTKTSKCTVPVGHLMMAARGLLLEQSYYRGLL